MLRAVMAVVVIALTAACGSAPDPDPTPAPTTPTASGSASGLAPGIATFESTDTSGVSDQASFTGTLELVDGCLRVRSDGGLSLDQVVVPVFDSRGLAWDGDTLTVDGTSFRLGDVVDLSGGVASNAFGDVPLACDQTGAWVVGGISPAAQG